MISYNQYEIWFLVGSQHLYGEEVLDEVEQNAKTIVAFVNNVKSVPIKIKFKCVLTSSSSIAAQIRSANYSDKCIGLITWMHTFSPAKMWINGLKILQKPLLHLHTQFYAEIPWDRIDMDYMNLHQSAHGGREFGFICKRLNINRKIVAGHWRDEQVLYDISVWARCAASWNDSQHMKIARFGDNMREVAVTEGNQVSAQIKMGYAVNGYGVSELENHINDASNSLVESIVSDYLKEYHVVPDLLPSGAKHQSLLDAARIEAGLRTFLEKGDFSAFTTTFENLGNLKQLPGIAVQRLMKDGYGFGAEGDWKTAALLRSMKVMEYGLEGGTSFMEDYTYHLGSTEQATLGAHMLEICPSISNGQPKCEIHPLDIGGKSDPVRLVFNGRAGAGINATIVDFGNSFKLLVNTIESIPITEKLPKLPVARILWRPNPSLKDAAQNWLREGGGHHTCLSLSLNIEYLRIFSEMANIELVVID